MDPFGTPRTLIARRRAGLLVPVLAIIVAGCSAAATPSSTTEVTRPSTPELGAAAVGTPTVTSGGPAIAPVPNGIATGGSSGSGSASSALAYPYPGFGGSVGLAPDHELVVSGTGWATVKADLSDRGTAQRTALAAALADAKAQAQAAAADASVNLGGVVSMSISVGGNYLMPMGVAEPPLLAPSTGGATSVPPATTGLAPSTPTSEQLEVTVTVAYGIS
jgi:hypothetical protein